MTNDPLAILVVPHAVIEWQKERGLLMKKHFPAQLKAEREAGKYAVFHNKLRLNGLYDTADEAHARIDEIIGNKHSCIENKRVYSVRQLPTNNKQV